MSQTSWTTTNPLNSLINACLRKHFQWILFTLPCLSLAIASSRTLDGACPAMPPVQVGGGGGEYRYQTARNAVRLDKVPESLPITEETQQDFSICGSRSPWLLDSWISKGYIIWTIYMQEG